MRVPSQLRKDVLARSKSTRVTKGRNGKVMLLHRSNAELAIRERSSLWQRIAGDADVDREDARTRAKLRVFSEALTD